MRADELDKLVDASVNYFLSQIVSLNNDETEYVVKAMQEHCDDWLNRLEVARRGEG